MNALGSAGSSTNVWQATRPLAAMTGILLADPPADSLQIAHEALT